MRNTGFSLIEVLVALMLLGALYTFVASNLQARRDAAGFVASRMQGWIWSDAAEVERQRGALPAGTIDAAALGGNALPSSYTPFGAPYRISANRYSAVVSADLPFRIRGGGVFTENEEAEGGTFSFSPRVFLPTAAMWDKVFLYEEAVR